MASGSPETILYGMTITYCKLLMTAIFWGGTFISGRMLAESVPPFSAAFFRFLIASVCLYAILARRDGALLRLPKSQLLPVTLLGLTGVLAYNAFFFNGLQFIEARRASIIIANNPIVISIFSALFFKERLSLLKCGAIVLSVTGAVIAISGGDPRSLLTGGLGRGDLLIFGCVLSWSAYSLLGKQVMRVLPRHAGPADTRLVRRHARGCAGLFMGRLVQPGLPGLVRNRVGVRLVL